MKLLKRLVLALLGLGLLGALAVYWLMFSPNTPDDEGYRGAKLPRGAAFEVLTDSLASAGVSSGAPAGPC